MGEFDVELNIQPEIRWQSNLQSDCQMHDYTCNTNTYRPSMCTHRDPAEITSVHRGNATAVRPAGLHKY